MTETNATPIEPTAETLPGGSPLLELRRLVLATRPQFLTASALPVVVGTAWAVGHGQTFHALWFTLALLATVVIHAGCNVINDVSDELNGSDRANAARIYPFTGGSRFIQNGIVSLRGMRRWALVLVGAGAVFGFLLALERGPGVLIFGIAGTLLGVAYSVPPLALVSRGLGEAVIAITFGALPVVGAAWLQGAPLDTGLALLWIPVAAWVASILLINEVPDVGADAAAGKRTLVVRLGNAGTATVYRGLQIAAIVAIVALAVIGATAPVIVAWALPAAFVGTRVAAAVQRFDVATPAELAGAIRLNLLLHAAGCLWLAVIVLFR